MKLSVFDQTPVAAGQSEGDAVRATLALADEAEALGYHRFWLSEHHANPTLAGSAPEIMIAAIAARTRRIRVGAAGILLPYYAPYKVAEQFRMLDAIAPGRIDLGIGRSPGGQGQEAALAAVLGRSADDHRARIAALRDWIGGRTPAPGDPPAVPRGATAPELWVLAGSCNGARIAAALGLPLAFNYSNGVLPDGHEAPLACYRDTYRPSPDHPEPRIALQVWALAAESAAEARRLFLSRALWRVQIRNGVRAPLADPTGIERRALSAADQAVLDGADERHVVGRADDVARRLRTLGATLGVEEMVIPTWTHDPAAKSRSYRLLAEAFGL